LYGIVNDSFSHDLSNTHFSSQNIEYSMRSIKPDSRIEDGPSILELCSNCKLKQEESKSKDEYQNQLRLIVIDCRLLMLQSEVMMPNTLRFDIQNNCDKAYIQHQVRQLIMDIQPQDHVCLLGLSR